MAKYRFLFSNPFPSDIQKMETFQGALHLPSPCTPRRAGFLVKLAGSASHKQEHTILCKWFSYSLAGREGVGALTTESPPRLWGTFPFKGPPPSPSLSGVPLTRLHSPRRPSVFPPSLPGPQPHSQGGPPFPGRPQRGRPRPWETFVPAAPLPRALRNPGETPEIKGSAADQVSSLVHRPRLIKLLTHKEIKPGPLPAVG